MAKRAAKPKVEKSIETQLWESANKLRGNIEASEYKHVVLSLIFLKYAGVRFERQYKKLQEEYGEVASAICNMPQSYAKDNVFYLPEECRWSYIMENAKQPNIPQIIDKALSDIEKSNKQLTGAMPVNYYTQVGIDPAKLGSLIDTINDMEKHMDDSNDFFGRVYEYCLSNFALQEGIINMDNQQSQEQISTKASSIGDYAIAALLGSEYTSCGRMQMYPSKDYITKVKPSSKSAWSAIEPGIMGDPELYFYAEYGQALGGNYKVNKDKKYVGVGYANRNHIVWKNVNFEIMRWSLFDNGTKMRYEWWEDDGGAIIQHKSSISLEMPTELGKLITPDPINFEIAIGKKDDFAGSVYVYYIDENKHNYNTSYVTFELEYKKQ